MQEQVIKVLNYFAFFDYSPAFEEVHAYLASKMSKKSLEEVLKSLVKRKRLLEKDKRYTLGEYYKKDQNSKIKDQKEKIRHSREKIRRLKPFLRLIQAFPQVKLVGLSGSVAMLNARKADDVDLFVVAAKNRLWTTRMICLLVGSLFGRRRFNDPHTSDKLCLNMFFDEAKLAIPQAKRTLYVGHEVLQMKPVVDREEAYRRFLEANDWVFKFFPNARALDTQIFDSVSVLVPAHLSSRKNLVSSRPKGTLRKVGDLIEKILRVLQLALINRHKTTEIITDTQLWFFPDDFEKKLNLSVVDRASFAMGKKQT